MRTLRSHVEDWLVIYLLPNAVTLDGIDDSILVDFIEMAVLIRCPELAFVTIFSSCSLLPTSCRLTCAPS